MAKIVRYNGNLQAFASAAIGTERTLFGEVTQADDLTSQFTADFFRGWGIVGPSDQPTLEDFNGAMYTHGQLLAYLHQVGMPEYNAAQEYHLNSLCNSGGVIYVSLINTNVGNTPASSPSQWRELYAAASETLRGSVELATAAETITGSSQVLATHPAGVAAAITAALTAAQRLPLDYFAGFTLSNNGGAPNTTVDVGAGSARDSTNTVDIVLTSTIRGILQSSGAWTAGDNQNKLDAGAKAINSTYHKFAIGHPTLADDILYSLSATAPTMPSGYVGFRRIGRVATDASGNIRQFKDRGNGYFDWTTPSIEITASAASPATSPLTITGMGGFPALLKLQIACGGDGVSVRITPTDVTNSANTAAPTTWTGGVLMQAGGGSAFEAASGEYEVRSDSSSQVTLRTFANAGTVDYRVILMGWREIR